jgi:glycosyltransferase involved in cell wall biosynthesis
MSFFSRIACQHAAGVVTCSPFDGRQIEAFYKIPPERICVMQLAAEEKFKQPVDPRALETLRKKYNLPKRYILSMGVILNRRNVPVLIEAFKKIRQDFPDAGLVVAGRNSTEPRVDFEELLKPLTERGQGAYITMVPEDELALFYAAASYYVCTSTVDGEALMLKESLLCGTPVITSPLLEETIGGNALLIKDPTNVPETVHILRQALSIKDMDRKNTARIGREWVSALSWEKAARNCMEFIEKA